MLRINFEYLSIRMLLFEYYSNTDIFEYCCIRIVWCEVGKKLAYKISP